MMKSKILMILGVLLFCLGGAQASAQEIYNKYQGDGIASDEEPTLYIKPKNYKPEKSDDTLADAKSAVVPEFTLVDKKLQAEVNAKIALYHDWIKSGKRPHTAEEIAAYADASRALSQALMFKRREQLIPYLEKQNAIHAKKQQKIMEKIAAEDKKREELEKKKNKKNAKPKKAKSSSKTPAKKSAEKPIYNNPKI